MVDEDDFHEEVGQREDLERALAALRPQASGIDRDRFLFLAGRAAAEAEHLPPRFSRWAWPASTLLSAGCALLLLGLLLARPAIAPQVADPQAGTSGVVSSTPAGPAISGRAADRGASDAAIPRGEIAAVDPRRDLGWVARLGFAGVNHPLQLHSYVLASRTQFDESARAEHPATARLPIEEPRSQRELLEEFLKTDRPASAASWDAAG
jgi:hypothetical protein